MLDFLMSADSLRTFKLKLMGNKIFHLMTKAKVLIPPG